ncbi:uncharacterized protein F4812DRAFT_315404 [Daldinia caldariorum]|uniref:uncharacterized protein n=1 Tax=Daldinia caldariorum TaxID=326644 RepID=UPI0020083468|nr:uncharacterized protein F4812DRAFT_315404 [Daldinia caldariorum]KAI1470127.1 hypothetical protein F4812DRAFT_315404 [Daldinia caldariorum]
MSLNNCFVNQVVAPIELIEISPPNQSDEGRSSRRISTAQAIEDCLNHSNPSDYSHRHLSICQRTSWSSLQVTRELLELFVSKHGISDSFWDLPSCFYHRNDDVEINFGLPVTVNRTDSSIEIYYTIRYPELKPNGGNWAIRQSGLYYRFDSSTSQIISVLFSPTPNSAAHQKMEAFLLGLSSGSKSSPNPWRIHEILFTTYFPAWREYLAFLERKLLPETSTTFATFIDEPLRVGYDNLSSLASLDSKFLQVHTLMSHIEDVLKELSSLFAQEDLSIASGTINTLDNHRRRSVAHCRVANLLQQRAQTTAQLLANTLSFRDQMLAKQQNGNMLQLNKSAVFLTTLTLLYLPASFVATFFGMNFFDLDSNSKRIVGTPMVWIYIVCSILLTVVTFLAYYWVLHHDDVVVHRMSPKVNVGDWRALARRALTMKGFPTKVENISV